ncbi:hypothetical protein L2E82_51112 [Cichorium intybus]|nr:hypothetical protein L2E82_51112 [Cichorium intybus]
MKTLIFLLLLPPATTAIAIGGFDFFMNDTATDRRQHHREIHHHRSNFDFLHITGLQNRCYRYAMELSRKFKTPLTVLFVFCFFKLNRSYYLLSWAPPPSQRFRCVLVINIGVHLGCL